jgi:hypothetical protein
MWLAAYSGFAEFKFYLQREQRIDPLISIMPEKKDSPFVHYNSIPL